MGGDEFAIILPNTTYDQATAIVQRIRKHTAKKLIGLSSPFSFGCYQTEPGEDSCRYAKAEEDMYQQKLRIALG